MAHMLSVGENEAAGDKFLSFTIRETALLNIAYCFHGNRSGGEESVGRAGQSC